MKKWSACLLIVLVFTAVWQNMTEAAQIPLQLQIYEEDGNEILVRLAATESLTLNAFTVEINYDIQEYELHQWNDEVPGGYGYSGSFRQQYERGGTIVSNDTPGKVVFSGMNASDSAAIPAGAFAQVSLIRYSPGGGEDGITLHITALNLNKESYPIEQNVAVSGEVQQGEAPELSMDISGDSQEPVDADDESGAVNSTGADRNTTSEKNGMSGNGAVDSAVQQSAQTETHADTASDDAVQDSSARQAQAGEKTEHSNEAKDNKADMRKKNSAQSDQSGVTACLLYIGAAVLCAVLLVAGVCIWRKKKLLRNDSVD